MATTIKAKPNQSMQDLVLMACGTLDGAMDFCRANGVAISDVPVAGNEYVVPAGIEQDAVVLTDLYQKGIVIGTLNQEFIGSDPYFGIILYPLMDADMIFPGLTGGYDMKLTGTAQFINAFDLPDGWPGANHILGAHKDTYELIGEASAGEISPFATLQSNKETRYFVGAGLSPIAVYMWWSDFSEPSDVTATYEDVAGWRATCAPLVLYTETLGSPVINTLLGTLDVSVDSVVGATVTLSIARGHTLITIPDFNLTAQSLAYRSGAGGIWTTVPSIDPFGGTVTIALTAGIYELALKSGYQNDDSTVDWPMSYISMIIEVY